MKKIKVCLNIFISKNTKSLINALTLSPGPKQILLVANQNKTISSAMQVPRWAVEYLGPASSFTQGVHGVGQPMLALPSLQPKGGLGWTN